MLLKESKVMGSKLMKGLFDASQQQSTGKVQEIEKLR